MEKKSVLIISIASILIISIVIVLLLSGKDNVTIANPASEYCVNQGYLLEISKTSEGDVGYCISDKERCEEWAFFRGECAFSENPVCVPASCCHSDKCVLSSEAPSCENTMCTMECRGGTMDCGAGYCALIDDKCEVVWNEN